MENRKLILIFWSLFFSIANSSILFAQNEGAYRIEDISNFDLDNLSESETYFLDSCLSFQNEAFTIKEKINYYEALENSFANFNNFHYSVQCIDSLIVLYTLTNDDQAKADIYTTKSLRYDLLGHYPEALVASQNGLEIYVKLKDLEGEAYCYNDIGVIHYYRGDNVLAQEYFKKSFDIFEELNDTAGIGLYYNNMANTLFDSEQFETALEMYERAFDIDVALGNLEGQSISMGNIGDTYLTMGEYDKAEKILLEALVYAEQSDDPWTILSPLQMLGDLYSQTNEDHKAIHVLKRSIKVSTEIGALQEKSVSFELLYKLYKKRGDYDLALNYFELFNDTQDEIFDQNKELMMLEMESKYQIEDKAQKIQILQNEQELEDLMHREKLAKNDRQFLYLTLGLGIFLVVIIFMIRGFLIKKKANKKLKFQNEIIENKNDQLQFAFDEIETKNSEILDSIRYAKRIQSAVLPSTQTLNQFLPNSFIMYKPKDVVAGDFYWLENRNNKTLFAAADCTGHGVPGAMVSVICNNALNRSVREHNITDPGEILNKTREIVIEEFEKSDEVVKDGMDVSLCSLEGEHLEYAGAHNSLWIIRKGKKEVEEIKADKQPIGKFLKQHPFTTHKIKVNKGDLIYLYTDGYADQFGGDKGKKFKSINFKELLIRISELSLDDQLEHINKSFEKWKGNLEQVDDVCVIGVRI